MDQHSDLPRMRGYFRSPPLHEDFGMNREKVIVVV